MLLNGTLGGLSLPNNVHVHPQFKERPQPLAIVE